VTMSLTGGIRMLGYLTDLANRPACRFSSGMTLQYQEEEYETN